MAKSSIHQNLKLILKGDINKLTTERNLFINHLSYSLNKVNVTLVILSDPTNNFLFNVFFLQEIFNKSYTLYTNKLNTLKRSQSLILA